MLSIEGGALKVPRLQREGLVPGVLDQHVHHVAVHVEEGLAANIQGRLRVLVRRAGLRVKRHAQAVVKLQLRQWREEGGAGNLLQLVGGDDQRGHHAAHRGGKVLLDLQRCLPLLAPSGDLQLVGMAHLVPQHPVGQRRRGQVNGQRHEAIHGALGQPASNLVVDAFAELPHPLQRNLRCRRVAVVYVLKVDIILCIDLLLLGALILEASANPRENAQETWHKSHLNANAAQDHGAGGHAKALEGTWEHQHGPIGNRQHQARDHYHVTTLCDHRCNGILHVGTLPALLCVAGHGEERVVKGKGRAQHKHHDQCVQNHRQHRGHKIHKAEGDENGDGHGAERQQQKPGALQA
mmetsp:Transcript_12621/g.29972  ORF Transcript_12621/g.29972 Transcript_12621/m.29972 type:complete len:351 (-) Transcript_12621:866-1918(-)